MQATWKIVLTGLLLAVPAASAQTPTSPHPATTVTDDESAARAVATPPRLAGTWRTQPDRFPLLSDFDKSVWGPNAQSEQTVELTLNAAGEGTLTIARRVIDAKGRTVPGSAAADHVKISVGAANGPAVATRREHAVTVVSAERHYPDDPTYRWVIEGARVNVVTFEGGDPNTVEVRYDTADGKVAIAEVLRRSGAAAGRVGPVAARQPAKAAPKVARP
jgi:hypothetical protein